MTENKDIKDLSKDELLDFIMENPEYLMDSYFKHFRKQIELRYRELTRGESNGT